MTGHSFHSIMMSRHRRCKVAMFIMFIYLNRFSLLLIIKFSFLDDLPRLNALLMF